MLSVAIDVRKVPIADIAAVAAMLRRTTIRNAAKARHGKLAPR
jgi:hypothetical protein